MLEGASSTPGAVNSSRRPRRGATVPDPEADLVASYQAELDDMRAQVADFPNMDIGEVLVHLAGIAGRLAEVRAQLYRRNSQRCAALRTREVDPLREDLDFQFKVHSRRLSLLEWELKLSSGGT